MLKEWVHKKWTYANSSGKQCRHAEQEGDAAVKVAHASVVRCLYADRGTILCWAAGGVVGDECSRGGQCADNRGWPRYSS